MSSHVGIQCLLAPETRYILYRILTEASVSKTCIDASFYGVCKSWCELLNELLITEETLSHPDNDQRYSDIQTINRKLLHSCFFYGLNDAILPATLEHASLLKCATIVKPISNENFLKLVPIMIENVKSLTLDQQAMHGLRKTSLACLQQLKELEVIIITGEYMTNREMVGRLSQDWNHNTNVLRRLLEVVDSKNLLQIAVQGYVMPHCNHDGYILESFLECVVKHRQTLKHITFETRVIKHKTEAIKKEIYMPEFNIKSFHRLRLTSLFFGGQFSCQLAAVQEIFKEVFETQASKGLRYAFCDFSKIENPISKEKLDSRKPYFNRSLVVLELTLPGDPEAQIDCKSLFGHCEQLRVLALSAGEKPETSEPVGPQLLNIASLPKSLEFFRVRRLNISQEDGEFIVWELSKLKLLELLDVGNDSGLGLCFSEYPTLMKTRHVEQLIFSHAFNKASMEEWAENGRSAGDPPFDETLGAFEKKHDHAWLKLLKSNNNQYKLVVNEEIGSYFPFEEEKVGAYRPRQAPNSDPDWVNNPYLKNALSFSHPLVFTAESEAEIAESSETETDTSDGSVSGDGEVSSEGEVGVEADKEQAESEGSESGEDEDKGSESEGEEEEEEIEPSASEIELDPQTAALEEFAMQAFDELGVDEAEIAPDQYENFIAGILDNLAEHLETEVGDEEQNEGAAAAALEEDEDSNDKGEEIIRVRAQIKMIYGGEYFAIRAETKARQAEAKAKAEAEAAAAANNPPEPDPDNPDAESSESEACDMEVEVETKSATASDHEDEDEEMDDFIDETDH